MEEVAMKRFWMLGGVALLALVMFAPSASAQRGFVRFGGPRFFGPSFYVGGPGFYPGWYGYGYYGLGWYEPYGYVAGPTAGKVKFETKAKNAQVYVDGAYAGTAQQLGAFPLKAGTHNVELRDAAGQTIYSQQVDVIAGKTLKIKS
jgi:hypothetical protein